ncbi:hypothetical protein RDI58_024738 [Solanum bulbocastanum]|uniref:DUF7798 domain-containing protein n=1 Tax=Solanum bulbocastanum TaxID=147425 RepID=A0AAN8T0D6_SOLBU
MSNRTKESEIVKTPEETPILAVEAAQPPLPGDGVRGGGGGWGGGWGLSAFSYLTDFQKAAAVAAEEISRNVALLVDSESSDKDNPEGLRVIDHSVENFASGIKGGSDLVHKLENSALNIAESIQHGNLPATPGSIALSIPETGETFSAKGMQALELLGRETMDLLISETGMDVDKSSKEVEGKIDEDQFFEEVTFDRCFYIDGGPEHLEELEALSNHYAMLFNRKKAKVPSDQRSSYDGKLKEVQQIFDLRSEVDGSDIESEKGKKVETGIWDSTDEVKNLHDSSVNKATELAAGEWKEVHLIEILELVNSNVDFWHNNGWLICKCLAGLAPNDMIQRTTGRLDTLHSEGVHRLSELCCFAVTQLLVLGKSIISDANNVMDQDVKEETEKIHWPEDSIERSNVILAKAQSMTRCVQAISSSFVTGKFASLFLQFATSSCSLLPLS